MRFSDWIAKHARGDVDFEVGDALLEVTEAVIAHGKKGTVTLTVTVDRNGRSVETFAEVKSKVPEANPESSMWFLGDGELSKDDPLDNPLFDDNNEPSFRVGDDGAIEGDDE